MKKKREDSGAAAEQEPSAPADTPAADTAATAGVSPLWPLSPRFPAPLVDRVRSQLPTPTLGAVRLVNRAARDEFVDGRATRVRRLWGDAPAAALARAAPRLRSLVSLDVKRGQRLADERSVLADALKSLPDGGAVLRELRLPIVHVADDDTPRGAPRPAVSLAAALIGLRGLTLLEVGISSPPGALQPGASAMLHAVTFLTALERLDLSILFSQESGAPYRRPPPPAALRPHLQLQGLPRLRALALNGDATTVWLPALFAAPVPAALSRLCDLKIDLSSDAYPLERALPPAPWRAPWLSQLTRLAVRSDGECLQRMARALAPRALGALRALEIWPAGTGNGNVDAAELRGLLAACRAPALEALDVCFVPSAALRDAAAELLPGLRALAYRGDIFWTEEGRHGQPAPDDLLDGEWPDDWPEFPEPGEEWRAFCDAPLARLTRLKLDVRPEVLAANSRPAQYAATLNRLFAAAWARSLRELELAPLGAPWSYDEPRGAQQLRALQGLSALTALRKLAIDAGAVEPEALELAAREGWADGWAPRLEEFGISDAWCPGSQRLSADALNALLLLPFARLERLVVRTGGVVTQAELAAFSAACAAALPRLTALDFSASRSV